MDLGIGTDGHRARCIWTSGYGQLDIGLGTAGPRARDRWTSG